MFKEIFPEKIFIKKNKTLVKGTLTAIKRGGIDDEWYTRRCLVDFMLLPHIDYLKDKKIYLPCDTEQSEFVKFMKDHNLNFKHTSDDYMKHDDLWQWADIIITNPPFSHAEKWLKRIMQFKKECWFIHNLWIPVFIAKEKVYNPLKGIRPYYYGNLNFSTVVVRQLKQMLNLTDTTITINSLFIRPDGSYAGCPFAFYRIDFNQYIDPFKRSVKKRKIDWLTFKYIDQ